MTAIAQDPWRADRNDGWAFLLSIAATVIVLAALAGLPVDAFQIPAGLVAGFFAPGYLLLRATVGGRLNGSLRLLLPVPLTLGLAAVVGVVLAGTPIGVERHAIGLALCGCSVVLALLVYGRGAHPVTLKPRDARPTVLDVLSSLVRRPPADLEAPPPVLPDLLLTLSVVLAMAVAGFWVGRAIDRSAEPADHIALTGEVRRATQRAGGEVRALVELSVVNDTPRGIKPVLRLATAPRSQGARRLERLVAVPAHSVRRVTLPLSVRCGGAVRAAISRSESGQALRSLHLRVRC